MKHWKEISLIASSSIDAALRVLNEGNLQIALVVDNDDKLLGTLTDGDIRRALLNNVTLDCPVHKIMNQNPITLPDDSPRDEVVRTLTMYKINQIPLIDSSGRIAAIETLHRIDRDNAQKTIPNNVIIMAGGLGTRLLPITENIPKPMALINGKPILEILIGNLAEQGFENIFISVNHKKELIQEYFADGKDFGVKIEYILENDRMGTAGSLQFINKRPDLPFIVVNGDIITDLKFINFLNFHNENHSVATMCLKEFTYQIPYGVVDIESHELKSVTEKPEQNVFVSAGMYVIDPECIGYIPENEFYDMPTLFNKLIKEKKKVCAFPLSEIWMDIGTPEDLKKARDNNAT